MKHIFITGSTNNQGTPNYKLQQELKQILDACMQRNDHIIIGDRVGVEAMAQGYLNGKHYPNVTVVHLNKQPRIFTNPDWNKEHIFTPEVAPDGSRMFERVEVKGRKGENHYRNEYAELAFFRRNKMIIGKADATFIAWNGQGNDLAIHTVRESLVAGKPVGLTIQGEPYVKFRNLDELQAFAQAMGGEQTPQQQPVEPTVAQAPVEQPYVQSVDQAYVQQDVVDLPHGYVQDESVYQDYTAQGYGDPLTDLDEFAQESQPPQL